MFQFIFSVFLRNYISWAVIVALAVVIRMDDKEKPEGTQWMQAIVGTLFILVLLQSVEMLANDVAKQDPCYFTESNGNATIVFYYFKTLVEHSMYCAILLMEVLLINRVKRKNLFLLWIPEIVTITLDLLSCLGIPLVFSFNRNGRYIQYPLSIIPYLMCYVYFVLLLVYSFQMMENKDRKKKMVLVLITVITFLTSALEMEGILVGYMDEIVGIDIMLYYVYFHSLYRTEMREKLYKQKLELEHTNNKLMMSQIQPHFIYNTLSVIRYLCREDQEMAVETLDHFADYLRQIMKVMTTDDLVPFRTEMKLVDSYLYIEQKRFLDKIKIVEDLQAEDFYIPLLTVQPIVENAIGHGIRKGKMKGTVTITSREEQNQYVVEVSDDGTGFEVDKLWQIQHIGIRNVKDRLRYMAGGSLEIESVLGQGTQVRIVIPKQTTSFS